MDIQSELRQAIKLLNSYGYMVVPTAASTQITKAMKSCEGPPGGVGPYSIEQAWMLLTAVGQQQTIANIAEMQLAPRPLKSR